MSTLKNLVVPPSLKQMAFNSIKTAILSKRLEPGKVYNEQTLAKELGISKTPVREALLDLTTKGFVTPLPRRGVQINVLTEKDISDLYEVRIALEIAIVRCVAPKLNEESLKEIEAIHKKEKEAIEADDRLSYLRIDREFHLCLASLTENCYMISSLENIRDLIDWMGFKALGRQERMKEVEQEHERIMEKLRKRDAEGAERLMEAHIRITMKNVLQQLEA